jgi:putative transposase
MKVNRVERHQISKSNPMWKVIDELCLKSKNVYNYGNYVIRQEFIKTGNWIRYKDLSKQIKHEDCFKKLGSCSAQMTLRRLDKNWKSFFNGTKEYKKNPSKFLGRPKIPKYKKKDGRYILELTNMQTHIINGYLYFAWKPLKQFNNIIKTNIDGRLLQTRFKLMNNCYMMEIVYEKEITIMTDKESKRICSIDLGVNNFVTMVNNVGEIPIVINGRGIKSYNQYWNKKLAYYKSKLKKINNKDWSNRLNRLTLKRYNKINNFFHKASKMIIDYCVSNNIDTIVIGKNDTWKQNCNMQKKVNQIFVQIPYENFIKMIKYKGQDIGITVIENEESYTSGTSFLDNETPIKENYNKNRRKFRGLFISNKGIKINADCNGAYQIMRKVFPKAFTNGIVGVHLHPIILNVA